jgi:hypothetical protein
LIKLWLALSGLVIFAAGGAVGFLAFRSLAPRHEGRDFGWIRQPLFPWDVPLKTEEIYAELKLDELQRKMIDFLLSSYVKRVSVQRSALSDLANELREALDAVLTPEQKIILASLQEKSREGEIQERVRRELQTLRPQLELTAEVEKAVEPILLDIAREKDKLYHSDPPQDRQAMREKIEAINARRLSLLSAFLSPSQLSKYKEIKERDRIHFGGDKDRMKKAPPTLLPPKFEPKPPAQGP